MSSKACKYECGTLIIWDNTKRIFHEQDGTSHTKERCESLREKAGKTIASSGAKVDPMTDLTAAVRELAAAIRSRPL